MALSPVARYHSNVGPRRPFAAPPGGNRPPNETLPDVPLRWGIASPSVVVLLGTAIAVTDMMRGARPMDVVPFAAYRIGIAARCRLVARLASWPFSK